MMYLTKWCIYSENSGNHIVSLCDDGTYQCDCKGWTMHTPRRNCKHIWRVIDEKPEPMNKANWDMLKGKKKKTKDAIAKMMESENPLPSENTQNIFNINGVSYQGINGMDLGKLLSGKIFKQIP